MVAVVTVMMELVLCAGAPCRCSVRMHVADAPHAQNDANHGIFAPFASPAVRFIGDSAANSFYFTVIYLYFQGEVDVF